MYYGFIKHLGPHLLNVRTYRFDHSVCSQKSTATLIFIKSWKSAHYHIRVRADVGLRTFACPSAGGFGQNKSFL